MTHPVLFQVAVSKQGSNPQTDKPQLYIVSSDNFVEFQAHHCEGCIIVVERFPDHCLQVSDQYLSEH